MKPEIISTGGALEDATDIPLDETASEAETRVCEVPLAMHGFRLDRVLAQLFPEFSRSFMQELVVDGVVEVRGVVVRKPAAKTSAGDKLSVVLRPTQQAQAFMPEKMDLQVVYEDADLLVVDKPAGLVVHPAAGNWSGTLLNGLLAWHAGASALPRAGIVHRLDKDTSGLMLVGKSRRAVDGLVRAIAAREVQRQYLAMAHGHWSGPAEQHVDQPIGRDVRNRLRMAVVAEGAGKSAKTTMTVLGTTGQFSLLGCRLHTGRTHQIRVHAAWLGHPLVGDGLYGGRQAWDMHRQALHAARLALEHPVTGEALVFTSPPPSDFQAALRESGLHYNGLNESGPN